MSEPQIQPLAECRDVALCGGKAANLGALLRAGFAVPPGFVVTTAGYHAAQTAGGMPVDLAQAVREAYRALRSGAVAVRSSATTEDRAGASMAGQYETLLDVTGAEALLHAVAQCWASLDTARARSYLSQRGAGGDAAAMGVVVQRLVPAEVAGVLFTANPHNGSREEMLIEASWGLGEAVVSGRVQPDVIRTERATGRVIETRVADKKAWVAAGAGAQAVEETRRRTVCLEPGQIAALWAEGCRIAEHFAVPQDVEWAIHEGQIFILQARPITVLAEMEAYEAVTRETRARVAQLLQDGGGPLVQHNLGETLPHPTALTWSVIQPFMSGGGGWGEMYRLAGFVPGKTVWTAGFLELVGGRVYMDAGRAPEMFFGGFPLKYDAALLRRAPDASQTPPTVASGSFIARFRAARQLRRAQRRLRELARGLDQRLDGQIIPAFVEWCRGEKRRDLAALEVEKLLQLWEERQKRVMQEFAPWALLPGMIVGQALAQVERILGENYWDDDPASLAAGLLASPAPDQTVRSSAELRDQACGRGTLADWISRHGHRGPDEFDLAAPRWRAQPEEVAGLAERLRAGPDPLELHRTRLVAAAQRRVELLLNLPPTDRRELEMQLAVLDRYLRFREDGKYYFMLGYDLLRDVALEAGQRLGLGEDVFLFPWDDVAKALRGGGALAEFVALRRQRRRAEGRMILPHLIERADFADHRECPTTTVPGTEGGHVTGAGAWNGFAVSAGMAQGPVRIVLSPEDAGELGQGYILVCPSTDPAWTPLFVSAAGLVLERGGMLSHGAVVAREMGVPAVVLPDATSLLQEAQVVVVDGRTGHVRAVGAEEAGAGASIDRPPMAGRGERAAARLLKMGMVGWGWFLLACFVLPRGYVYEPTLGWLDTLLWPLARWVGSVGTVALLAGFLAALTMLGQWLLTDIRRLREAKRRTQMLVRAARESPRDAALQQEAQQSQARTQVRLMTAACVPLAMLMGPLVLIFLWIPARLDPAAWRPPGGANVTVVATVAANWRQPVTLAVSPPLGLDSSSPAARVAPPIRETLERLAAQWGNAGTAPASVPLRSALVTGGQPNVPTLAELRAYLARGVPAQRIAWTVTSATGAEGSFPLVLRTPGALPLVTPVVLGRRDPPHDQPAVGRADSPLLNLQVVYPPAESRPVFFTPLASLGWGWDAGWLWTYVAVYVAVMALLRKALRIP